MPYTSQLPKPPKLETFHKFKAEGREPSHDEQITPDQLAEFVKSQPDNTIVITDGPDFELNDAHSGSLLIVHTPEPLPLLVDRDLSPGFNVEILQLNDAGPAIFTPDPGVVLHDKKGGNATGGSLSLVKLRVLSRVGNTVAVLLTGDTAQHVAVDVPTEETPAKPTPTPEIPTEPGQENQEQPTEEQPAPTEETPAPETPTEEQPAPEIPTETPPGETPAQGEEYQPPQVPAEELEPAPAPEAPNEQQTETPAEQAPEAPIGEPAETPTEPAPEPTVEAPAENPEAPQGPEAPANEEQTENGHPNPDEPNGTSDPGSETVHQPEGDGGEQLNPNQ